MTHFTIAQDSTITIEIPAATVMVKATEREGVDVNYAPANPQRAGDREAAERVTAMSTGGGLEIKADKRLLIGTNGSVDVELEVPLGSNLKVTVAAGALRLTGRLGDLSVKMSAGDVTGDTIASLFAKMSAGSVSFGEVYGDVEIQQSTGETQLGAVGGHARIKSGHGSLRLESLSGEGNLVTATGSVQIGDVTGSAGGEIRIKSGHGNIKIGRASRGNLVLDSGFGAIEVGVAQGSPVWVDANSKSGIVRSELEADSGPEGEESPVEIHANTKFGDIFINRAS